MDSSPTHTAQPRVESSRSPGTAESRTGSAVSGCWDHPHAWIPTICASVQDTMARTMQTARDPNYRSDGSGGQTPEGETSGSGHQTAQGRSPPRAPQLLLIPFWRNATKAGKRTMTKAGKRPPQFLFLYQGRRREGLLTSLLLRAVTIFPRLRIVRKKRGRRGRRKMITLRSTSPQRTLTLWKKVLINF